MAPVVLSEGNCQYTPISTSGTTTVDPGRTDGNPPGQPPGAFYGFEVLAVGTSWVVTALDIIVQATGTGTTTTTNTIATGTASAQGQIVGPSPLGIRYKGSLVIVTSGTAGAGNALWD